MIKALFINLTDEVPFSRVYGSKAKFLNSFKRMKNTVLDHAIDYNTMRVIRPNNLKEYGN